MNRTIAHYRILDRIGGGGMGNVYRAEDERLKRIVALKFLSAELAANPEDARILIDEARHAALLNHPHIAIIHELGEAGGTPYIVMEYVEGETLARKMERGPIEISAALSVAIQVADALSAAHAHGVIHCDIKSSNIMLTDDDSVKVLDFGLARLAPSSSIPTDDIERKSPSSPSNEIEGSPSAYEAGAVAGTASYMPPEGARGESLDARADIFSLGVVLFEMLTARRPFEADSRSRMLNAIMNEEAPPLSAFRDDIPLELESIIRRALEKDRRERYPSAQEILSDIRRLKDRLDRSISFQEEAELQASPELKDVDYSITSAAVPATSQRWLMAGSLYRKWLLLPGVLALLAVGLDIVILQPQGGERIRDAVLLIVAAICFIGYAILRRKPVIPIVQLPEGAAFRGLLPFQEADRDRFYGREMEAATLFEIVAHNDFRFGVLYGESGSGKSSLVRAALSPRLWEEGYAPVYCRSHTDPMKAILEECRRLSGIEVRDGVSPVEYIRQVTEELNSILIIICDQFEEFFINFKTLSDREPLLSFVAACHNDRSLPVKFLFSMRSDFLYLINSEFEGRVSDPLMSSRLYHLRNFDRERAEEVIEKSARRANLPFETGLSRQVARDLASGDSVLPSELQIVGERLQSKRIHTIQEYRRAGGKEPLVHSFLEDVIRASGDEEGAKMLLRGLISDENTRLTLPLEEIARRTQRSRASVKRLLDLFVQSRLVLEIQEEEPWRYELMHEYLIEKINHITGRVMDATQRANRLLRQYLSNYSVDRSTRIPLGKLWFIRRYSDAGSGERPRELMSKSLRLGVLKLGVMILLLGAGAGIAAAAFSVNEEWEMIRLSDGHTVARRAIFSPDGRLLVSGGEDAKVMVWDFARRERIATLTGHTATINSIAFSPDGRWIATGSNDKSVIVWDAGRMEKVTQLREHDEKVGTVAFSPDGRMMASAAGGRSLIMWETGSWKKLHEIPYRSGNWSFLFIENGRRILYLDGQVWDTTTAQQISGRWTEEIGGNASAVSPEGKLLVTVTGEGNVLFLNLAERKLLSRHRAHRDHGSTVAISPDGRLGATAAENIVLWDLTTQTKLSRMEHTANVRDLSFSSDGRWLVSAHGDGAILLWDVEERERVGNLNEHTSPVRAVAFSHDGKRLASAGDDRSIIVWDAMGRRKESVMVGHENIVMGAAFSPDGKSLASCDQDATVILWDVEKREPRWKMRYPVHAHSYCLAFSPDGKWVATSAGVYDSADGRRVMDFIANNDAWGRVYGLAFSPDGNRLACATENGHIVLLDVGSWQIASSTKTEKMTFRSIGYSPDGKRIVTGEGEGSIRIWEAEALTELIILGRHAARVRSAVFSLDGREVVSASDDQTIALWDVEGKKLISRIGTHTAPVNSVAFSPDGNQVASGEHDRSVRIYTRHRALWGYRID